MSHPGHVRTQARTVALDALAVTSAVVVYFGVRGLTVGDPGTARAHARDLLQLERLLGVDVEQGVQAALHGFGTLTTVANWIYIWGHWPMIVATLIWLALHHRVVFRRLRDAMVLSGLMGLCVYATYPVAPPRLAGLGMIDTVSDQSTAYRVLQPPAFVNQYAAMPSLHVGWDLLVGLALLATMTAWAVRLLGVVLPLAMAGATILTANHYVLDVLVGAGIALVGWAVAGHLEHRRDRRGGAGRPHQACACQAGSSSATRRTAGPAPGADTVTSTTDDGLAVLPRLDLNQKRPTRWVREQRTNSLRTKDPMKLARTSLVLLAASATALAVAVLPAAAQEATPLPSSTPSTPSPAPTACTKPTYEGWSVSPERAAAGDPVALSGARQDLCLSSEPPHDIRLLARPQGEQAFQEVAQATTGSDGRFSFTQRPTTTTTYQVTLDGRPMNNVSSTRTDTVVIDRVSGSCRNGLQLNAPSSVDVGSQVLVSLSRSDTATATISFRRRGQATFTVRRVFPSGPQSADYQTYFIADDDYRFYASNERCDSQPILVTAAPVITGPAAVRRGSTVTLTVRETPGMALAVSFRRAGQTTFAVRRTGTAASNGIFTATYKADADYQYYAAERPGQESARRITQAR